MSGTGAGAHILIELNLRRFVKHIHPSGVCDRRVIRQRRARPTPDRHGDALIARRGITKTAGHCPAVLFVRRLFLPFVPAKAGTQGRQTEERAVWPLDSRLRGNERSMG
mgnify:CR=1 FL=1